MAVTIEQARNAFLDNADYDGDVTKAKAFVAAGRQLLLMPADSRGRQNGTSMSISDIRVEVAAAVQHLRALEAKAANSSTNGGVCSTRSVDFRGFRS